MAIRNFPLEWPVGWRRTEPHKRRRAAFQVGDDQAGLEMMHELELLGARQIVVSSNVQVRRDGLPYAGEARRTIADPGVAVFFHHKGKPQVIAIDQYDRPKDNIRAIGLTVAAMRTIKRHGSAEVLDRTFSGFSLPPAPPAGPPWRRVFGWRADLPANAEVIRTRYHELALKLHPDREGGSEDAMQQLNRAFQEALQEVGG